MTRRPTTPLLSALSRRTTVPPILWLMDRAAQKAGSISFAAGLVDAETMPARATLAAARRVLGTPARARAALQYGTTIGLLPLRRALVRRFLAADGGAIRRGALTERHVVVANGSQQMLSLVSQALLDPGDIVVVSDPTYFVFASALESAGARVLAVPSDGGGMRTDDLERRLRALDRAGRGHRVKLLYSVSYFENPTGLSLAPERRRVLFRIAAARSRRHPLFVLEDAAYRDLRYEGPDAPSIKSLDRENRIVVYTGTFSKPFSPGLRIGYGLVPDALMGPILRLKGNQDFGSPNFAQALLLDLVESGAFDRQIVRLRRRYREKRDAMLEALERRMPEGVSWRRPQGGFYVWLSLPAAIDAGPEGPLFNRCLDRGVLYVPGAYCYAGAASRDVPRNEIRLSFSEPSVPAIREGVRRLAACVREALAGRQPRAVRR